MPAFHILAIGGAVLLGVIAAFVIYRSPDHNMRRAERKRRRADFLANWRKIIDEATALDEAR
jgi:hypothetical protein